MRTGLDLRPFLSRITVFLTLATTLILAGCSAENISFMDPQGPIAAAQRRHLIKVTAITMIVVLPVLVLVPILLWRYRYSNRTAVYAPNWGFSSPLELLMWGVPFAIILVLSVLLWHSVHDLDPYKPIASRKPALEMQVVGFDWKWLFIYPEQRIASVGEMAFVADRPVSLRLTSDTVMQSFMISALGGQIYAMPGMVTWLELKANSPGQFEGENTQYSGSGFHAQKFRAVAMKDADFNAWVARIQQSGIALSHDVYRTLGRPSTAAQLRHALGAQTLPPGSVYFSDVPSDLFSSIIAKYRSDKPIPPGQQPGAPSYGSQPGRDKSASPTPSGARP